MDSWHSHPLTCRAPLIGQMGSCLMRTLETFTPTQTNTHRVVIFDFGLSFPFLPALQRAWTAAVQFGSAVCVCVCVRESLLVTGYAKWADQNRGWGPLGLSLLLYTIMEPSLRHGVPKPLNKWDTHRDPRQFSFLMFVHSLHLFWSR